jgi:large subunit ribosomal protein L6
MSRIGKMFIKIPEKVKVTKDGGMIKAEGPLGRAQHPMAKEFDYAIENGGIKITPVAGIEQNKLLNALYGMERSILNSRIIGLTALYSKTLLLKGVGYRAALQGMTISLTLGFSHPVIYNLPEGVKAVVDNQTKIILSGTDKQAVGQAAAEIRELKKPEPYQGKGIMYENERVRRKAGKSAATAGAGGGAGAGPGAGAGGGAGAKK